MDLFSTNVLNAVVADLRGNAQFLIDRYFSNVQSELTEEIHFDVLDGIRRIAPFVSPLVEGQIVAQLNYRTNTFKPAYIKDKRVFDMNRPLKRMAGEQLTGSMAPANRLRALVANEMVDQVNMLNRRLEVMAGEVLATGKSTIAGDKYPQAIIDFGRAAGNTITASPLWSVTTANPLDDMQNWSQTVLKATGVMLTDVVMTVDSWIAFRGNQFIKDRLNLQRVSQTMPSMGQPAQIEEGGVYMGNIDGFNIFVYSGWYVDPADGVEKAILPAGTVLLCSPALEGVRAYGAIRDEEAGLQAVPYYVKSWVEPDPSVRFIMLQSAPLLVPYRPNASFKAKVI
jgi:Phage major capsid protein E